MPTSFTDRSKDTEKDAVQKGVRLLNEVEKAWLAGVIDGEGSIFLAKISPKKAKLRRGFYYRPAVIVANSNVALPNRVREVIGRGSVGFCKQKNPRWKDKWQYLGSGLVVRELLPQILFYLVVKRRVAEAMLEYLSFVDANPVDGAMQIPPGYHAKLDSLYWTVKRLNEKGEKPTDQASGGVSTELSSLEQTKESRSTGNRAKPRQMNEPEKAWLAAVVDGEGSIFLSKVRHPNYRRGFFYGPQLGVSNTNRAFLAKLREVVGEGTVSLAKKKDGKWKARWEYQAAAGVLRSILPQIMPYLIVKRAQAQKMLDFFIYIDDNRIYGLKEVPAGYYDKLDTMYRALKETNRKGRLAKKTEN